MVVALLPTAACVHPPRAIAPVRWGGAIRAGHLGLEGSAAPESGAPVGVLRLQEARLECPSTGPRCHWSVRIDNPWRARFEVTVTVVLRDPAGGALANDEAAVVLGPGPRLLQGELPAPPEPRLARSFTVEYWVRPTPPPVRAANARR